MLVLERYVRPCTGEGHREHTDEVTVSGRDAAVSLRPPTRGIPLRGGRSFASRFHLTDGVPPVTSPGASRAGRLGHSRSSRWPSLTCLPCGFAGGAFPGSRSRGCGWTAGREPHPRHLLGVGTYAITEPCRASVSFSVCGNSNCIIIIKKTVKTKRVHIPL